jgi:hypothetical protein
MKQITILLLFSLLLFSCNNDKIQLTQEQYKQLVGDTIKPEYPKTFNINENIYTIWLGSDKHEYYLILEAGYCYSKVEYYHYPDCVKCKKDTI